MYLIKCHTIHYYWFSKERAAYFSTQIHRVIQTFFFLEGPRLVHNNIIIYYAYNLGEGLTFRERKRTFFLEKNERIIIIICFSDAVNYIRLTIDRESR